MALTIEIGLTASLISGLTASGGLTLGMISSSSELPTPPLGFGYIIDDSGNYFVDDAGNYFISEV